MPALATREASANALCHRDYSIIGGSVGEAVYDDRLEISSSGELHFGLTPDKLLMQHDSHPWNPLIAHVFFLRGIIEEWGRGTLAMARLAASAGLPPLQIQNTGRCVRVCSWYRRSTRSTRGREDLEIRQQEILEVLDLAGCPLKRREIGSRLRAKATDRQLLRDLSVLRKKGLAVITGRGTSTSWKRSH